MLLVSVLPVALLLALIEPWYDADWNEASWETSRIARNLYAFCVLGLAHAILFGLPVLALAKRLNSWSLPTLTMLGMAAVGGPWLLLFSMGIRPDLTGQDYQMFGKILAVPITAGGMGGIAFGFILKRVDPRAE